MAQSYASTMSMRMLALAILTLAPLHPLEAQRHRGDQDDVYKERREGALMSLRSIENSVVPGMTRSGASYIGAEFDGGKYRLKFMRNGSVIWVDVDGRSGAIVARAGD
jgi:hypothetical protein